MAGVETGVRPLPIESDLLGHEGLHILKLLVRRVSARILGLQPRVFVDPETHVFMSHERPGVFLQSCMLPSISPMIHRGVLPRVSTAVQVQPRPGRIERLRHPVQFPIERRRAFALIAAAVGRQRRVAAHVGHQFHEIVLGHQRRARHVRIRPLLTEAAVIGQFRLNHHSHFVGCFIVFGNFAVRVQTDVVETILLHNPQMPGVLFSRRGRTHHDRIRVIVAATAQKVSHVVQIQVAATDFVFFHAETLYPAIDRASRLLQHQFGLVEKRTFGRPRSEGIQTHVHGQLGRCTGIYRYGCGCLARETLASDGCHVDLQHIWLVGHCRCRIAKRDVQPGLLLVEQRFDKCVVDRNGRRGFEFDPSHQTAAHSRKFDSPRRLATSFRTSTAMVAFSPVATKLVTLYFHVPQ